MTYFISTDATCDLPEQFYENNFSVLPMTYIVDNVEYDGVTNKLTIEEFYDKVRNGSMPTTSLINEFTAREFFEPILKTGVDILHICFSSGLSGSYKCVLSAAEELNKEYPNKITVIDSCAASTGEGLLVYYAMKKRAEGATYAENCEYVENLKQHICHYVAVDDLFHLFRGGRVNKAQAILGTMLGLKPLLYVNKDGKLIPIGKIKGRKKSLIEIVNKMEEKMYPIEEQSIIIIGHSACEEDAQFVAKKVIEKFPTANVQIATIGTVIGAHTGIGTVAIFFKGVDKFEPNDKE